MRCLVAGSLIVLASISPAFSKEVLREMTWTELKEAGQLAAGEIQLASGQWWDDRTAGLVGGIAGTVLGCLGGLIGMLAGVGKAREFVMLLTAAIVLAGVACLALAIVALLQTQPYCVYYPLLLLGGLSVLVMGPLRQTLRRRYQHLELRRIAAMDVASTG